MKYKVEIKETLVREVEIEAESRADAEQKIEDKWKNEEIVLSSDDFSFVNYTASPVIVLENNGENKAYYCDSIGFKEIENFLKEPDKQQDNSIDEINNDEPDICDEY